MNKINARILATVMAISVVLPQQTVPIMADEGETEPINESQSIVKITTIDTTNSKNLEGAELQIYKDNSPVNFSYNTNGEYTYNPNGGNNVIKSDYTGSIQVKGLPNGYYNIKYTGNISGYKCETEKTFTVSSNSSSSIRLNFAVSKGNANLSLYSENNEAISGAVFNVFDRSNNILKFSYRNGEYYYDANGNAEISTNTGGKISMIDLPIGTYTLQQVSAPEIYNGDLVLKEFTVYATDTANIVAVNKKEYGDLYVTLKNPEGQLLKGAEFKVRKSDGQYMTFNIIDGEYEYRKNGEFTSIPLSAEGERLFKNLPRGNYTLEQAKSPNGYHGSELMNFKISLNNRTTMQVLNERTTGNLTIITKDDKSKKGIAGFKYSVSEKGNNAKFSFNLVDGTYVFDKSGKVTELESNENGEIKISGIPTATVTVSQISTSENYVSDKAKHDAEIENDKTATIEVLTYRSDAIVNVKDKKKNPVKDVLFEIVDEDGKSVLETQTNESGNIDLSKLEPGTYYYAMRGVPSGYSRDRKQVKFTINKDGKPEGLKNYILDSAKITIQLDKIEGKSPKGAVFALVDKDGKEKYKLETNENGVAIFDNLPYGEYIIKQISVPDGYKLVDDTLTIKINEKYTNIDQIEFNENGINVEGDHNKEKDEIITESNSKNIIFIVIGILIAICSCVCGFIFYKKKKQKDNNASDDSIDNIDNDSNNSNDEELSQKTESTESNEEKVIDDNNHFDGNDLEEINKTISESNINIDENKDEFKDVEIPLVVNENSDVNINMNVNNENQTTIIPEAVRKDNENNE